MFLMAPFFIWMYLKNKNAGKAALSVWYLIVVGITFFVAYDVKGVVFPLTEVTKNAFDWFYLMPQGRAAPYFFGMIMGIYYQEQKSVQNCERSDKFMNVVLSNRAFRVVLSLLGIGLMCMCIWIVTPLQDNPEAWTSSEKYFWAAAGRVIFPLGLGMFILPSLFGKNRLFRAILNNAFFTVGSRIAICGYLVHLMIILTEAYSSKGNYFPNDVTMIYAFLASTVLSCVLAVILVLTVESPFVNLEARFILKRGVKRRQSSGEPSLIIPLSLNKISSKEENGQK